MLNSLKILSDKRVQDLGPRALEQAPALLEATPCFIEAAKTVLAMGPYIKDLHTMLRTEYGFYNAPEYINQVSTTVTDRHSVTEEDPEYCNLRAFLGKPAERGDVTNIGDNMAILWFLSDKNVSEANRSKGPIYLPPASTYAIKTQADIVLVLSYDASPAWVQITAQ